jgi:FAD/FMN-containing dehydrogenase
MQSDTTTGLRDIVGDAAVSETMAGSAPGSPAGVLTFAPRLSVRPANTMQVQRVVAWANETGTPLVPVSSGAPHLRGSSSPSVPEAVEVDLRGMTKILGIDRRNRLVHVEPGVTFAQLIPVLADAGLRMVVPLLPRPNKSVIASLLEREPTLVPRWHWNMTEPLRGLEVVWGDGERLLTGTQTRSDDPADWATGIVPMLGSGPGQIDFIRMISGAQGSMGIATWASVKVEPISDVSRLVFVPASSLEALIDCTYRLLRVRFADELFIANHEALAMLLARGAERAALGAQLPRWCLVLGVGGGSILGAEKVASRMADIADIVQAHGRQIAHQIPGASAPHMLALLQNVSPAPYWRDNEVNGSRSIFFMTTLDRTPRFVAAMNRVNAGKADPTNGIGVYLQPVHVGEELHCEFILPFDRPDAAQAARVDELFGVASRALFREGAYYSRPYGIWAEMAFNADAATTEATRKIKKIFDPNHVMNPGKLCF